MASSGYKDFAVSGDGYIKIRYSWSAGTANVANNFTPVNWTLQLISSNSSANISSSVAKNYSVTTDGTVSSGTNTVGLNGGATRTLASGSKNIYHNSDGTKTFNYSFSQAFNINYSGATIGTISGSGTGTLNTIPRGSTLGTISNFVIGNSITIPITKYSTSFSDTLNIYIGGNWIKRVEGLTNNQTVTFTESELNLIYAAMAYVTSATFTFTTTTYSGANVVGTSTKTATGTIASAIVPSITSVSVSEAVEDIKTQFALLVQNKSKLNVTINAAASRGSSIETYNVSINGTKYVSGSFTTDVLKTSGTNTYSVTVTDKRGKSVSTSGTFSVTAYTSPTISKLSVVRCNADGSLNDDGAYAKVNASASITSLSNKNTKSFILQYKQRNSTTWTTDYTYTGGYSLNITDRVIANISSDYPYDFRILVSDYFEKDVVKNYSLSSGQPVIDIRADGKGIAFFKVCDKQAVQSGKDLYDRFDNVICNGLSLYKTNGVDIDPNTTLDELILTETNVPPGGGFYYIRTMFYATKSITSNRTQIAIPYGYDMVTAARNHIYIRIYVNGIEWSVWQPINSQLSVTDYAGTFKNGSEVRETGWVSITPSAANTPTAAYVAFKNTYKKIPVVLVTPSTGVIGTQVLGAATNGITTTGVNIVITRTNTVTTTVYYFVIGEV